MAARKVASAGGKPDKLMRDALMLALKREAQDADGKPTTRLRIVAEKLVLKAMEGDITAIREVADRVDGKAIQAAEVTVVRERASELTDDELARIIAEHGRGGIAPSPVDPTQLN